MSTLSYGRPVAHSEISVLGAVPLLVPLLERMNVAEIIDRCIPPGPCMEYSHGQVLRALLAARLCRPTALMNVAEWAGQAGLEFFWDIPAHKLNDDRLARSLDAFFEQRHTILASVAQHVIAAFDLPVDRLHYDLTDLVLYGAYDSSTAIPADLPLPPDTSSANYPPAFITHGYLHATPKMINVGLCSIVDEFGGVPIFGHTLDGNRNGHTGIDQMFAQLQSYVHPEQMLMVSDRGTFSAAHAFRLHQAGHRILCSVPWRDVRSLFEQHRAGLAWREASYLSLEQQRRRRVNSTLSQEHYDLAVVPHVLNDPAGRAEPLPCRVIFVFSTAGQKAERQARDKAVAKIRTSLEELAAILAKGHPSTKIANIPARVGKILGRSKAARYFTWRLVELTAAEQAVLPRPQPGCKLPTHRLEFAFDQAACEADAVEDGHFALLTTDPLQSADQLFGDFRKQAYVEHSHHQWKSPLAVCPILIKTPERLESLVYLLKMALTAYNLIQRLYRQHVPAGEPEDERRRTTENILQSFANYAVIVEHQPTGPVVRPTQLTADQRQIVARLGIPSPIQLLYRRLPTTTGPPA